MTRVGKIRTTQSTRTEAIAPIVLSFSLVIKGLLKPSPRIDMTSDEYLRNPRSLRPI
jgi:hypothetical protein